MSESEYDGPEYANITPPDDIHPHEFSYVQRRAEIYRLIEEAGHPRNLRRSQKELAERYDTTQQNISKDIKRLREYQRVKTGNRAVATTRWLHEKVVTEELEQSNWTSALEAQMEYNDFLFKLGQLDEAPDELHVSGDAGEAYMEMLRQASEDEPDSDE